MILGSKTQNLQLELRSFHRDPLCAHGAIGFQSQGVKSGTKIGQMKYLVPIPDRCSVKNRSTDRIGQAYVASLSN